MSTNESTVSEESVRNCLRGVFDPEFGVSVEDLGLIYGVKIDAGRVEVVMTLTSMYCPAGQVIMTGIQSAIEKMDGVTAVDVQLVWEPTWTPEMLSADAREQLGWKEPKVQSEGP
jgi:metal-sulfur cluster biosynthetic enzyme